MHWWRRDLLHNEGNSYHFLLTTMSLKCLVHWVHLRLKATTTNWQPESVLQNKKVVVFISALEKSCVWVSFWVFRGHQKTENTLTLHRCKQIPLLLMTNISHWIMVKKLLFFWSNWANSSVCGVPLSLCFLYLTLMVHLRWNYDIDYKHMLMMCVPAALHLLSSPACEHKMPYILKATPTCGHSKHFPWKVSCVSGKLELILWKIYTQFAWKISLCISVTRPLRLLGNLKEWLESGDNNFYLHLLIVLEIILSIHLQK